MKYNQVDIIAHLRSCFDKDMVLTGNELNGRFAHIWRTEVQLEAKAILFPRSTDDVAAICKICTAYDQSIVVHGGLTGLVGGTLSDNSDIVISMEKMDVIEEIDPLCRTMTVQAGCILSSIHDAADFHNLFFPLNFGAKGSAQIGGCVATNAGGLRVKRFGMTRNLIIGLEVVLADGTIINGIKKIIKDNAGYNLNQLFIGSEGTLGIVTRATLRLEEKLINRKSVFVGLAHFKDAIHLLRFCDAKFSGLLSAFEVIWANTFDALSVGLKSPFSGSHNYYVLLEVLDNHILDFEKYTQDIFAEVCEKNIAQDVVFANTAHDQELFWGIRENVEALNALSPYQQHFDISVPIDKMAEYSERVSDQLSKVNGVMHSFCFGHMADGNLHFLVGKNTSENALKSLINEIVYNPLNDLGGSVSAEHGIGLEKKASLGISRSKSEIALMRKIKQALDPKYLLNPGKIIDKNE